MVPQRRFSSRFFSIFLLCLVIPIASSGFFETSRSRLNMHLFQKFFNYILFVLIFLCNVYYTTISFVNIN